MSWTRSLIIFLLLCVVGVHGFQYKGSIQLIRKSHRSATHVFNVAQRVKSDDAVGEERSGKFRAKRGTGNSVISDIESILGALGLLPIVKLETILRRLSMLQTSY